MNVDALLQIAAEVEQDCSALLGLPDSLNGYQIQHIEKAITNMQRFSSIVKANAEQLQHSTPQNWEPGFELRTFLTTAIGQPQIILFDYDKLLSEKQREYLVRIIDKGEKLGDMLTGMTDESVG